MTTQSVVVLPNLRPTAVDKQDLCDTFRDDVVEGLTRERNKSTPAKHLYDGRGSELFEQICELEEYYPTRTEASIYDECMEAIADDLGEGVTLIEPGAGSGEKAARLLAAMRSPRAFVPIEISLPALESCAAMVARRFPDVEVWPVCGDFTAEDHLPCAAPDDRRVVFFPGSTIGNLEPRERAEQLARFRSIAQRGGRLLIGFDLVKDPDVLRAAYNDREGVTAQFNLNLVDRINRELGGTLDVDRISHDAPWVPERSRIEMHLVSEADQQAQVAGRPVRLARGERIHTESSYKFRIADFDAELEAAGFRAIDRWTDARDWFCVGMYEAVA